MENLSKLVVVIIGQNCEKHIKLCLESVKDASMIVYLDGGSVDKTLDIVKESNALILENRWDDKDKKMNGKQRNFYLNYLKNNFIDWWALVLDADEMVEDLGIIKEFIKSSSIGAYSVKMRHFIGDLGHEDNTRETHYVPNRLFKISEAKGYPEHSHPVLICDNNYQTDCTTIWHMGHLPVEYMHYIVKRTKQHKEDSIIHNREFIDKWGDAHLFGKYPVKEINPREIPKLIYDNFNIDFGEMYSKQEQIEFKHHLMVKQWYDYLKPTCVLDVGCGRGAYLYYWQWFTVARGRDINKWAVKNAFTHDVEYGDVTSKEDMDIPHSDLGELTNQHSLITAIDVLEHLDDEQLNKALDNMHEFGVMFLFSIPFIGDPNLLADGTHKQFKTKEDWIKLIESHGIKIKETPKDWLFSNQILIGEK